MSGTIPNSESEFYDDNNLMHMSTNYPDFPDFTFSNDNNINTLDNFEIPDDDIYYSKKPEEKPTSSKKPFTLVKQSLSKTPKSLDTSFIKDKIEKLRDTDYELTDAQNEKIVQTLTTFGCLLAEQILCHPIVSLTTQIHVDYIHLNSFFLSPFAILKPVFNIIRTQGLCAPWKGLTTSFITIGVMLVTENTLSDFLDLPREVDFYRSSWREIFRHLTLKILTFGICSPLYAANMFQIIQSYIIHLDTNTNNVGAVLNPINTHSSSTFLNPASLWEYFKDVSYISLSAVSQIGKFALNFLTFGQLCGNTQPSVNFNDLIIQSSTSVTLDAPPLTSEISWSANNNIGKYNICLIFPCVITGMMAHYLVSRYFATLIAAILDRIEKERQNLRSKYQRFYQSEQLKDKKTDKTKSMASIEREHSPSKMYNIDGDFIHVLPRMTDTNRYIIRRSYLTAIAANFAGRSLADFFCYPLTAWCNLTVMNILHNSNISHYTDRITLIDDLNSGLSVLPFSGVSVAKRHTSLLEKNLNYNDSFSKNFDNPERFGGFEHDFLDSKSGNKETLQSGSNYNDNRGYFGESVNPKLQNYDYFQTPNNNTKDNFATLNGLNYINSEVGNTNNKNIFEILGTAYRGVGCLAFSMLFRYAILKGAETLLLGMD